MTRTATEPTPAQDFRRWLEDPEASADRVYWKGWLPVDAQADPAVRELAAAALYASGALPCTRRTGDGRSGQIFQPPAGPALVELSQRRLGEGEYEYRARKLRGRRSP